MTPRPPTPDATTQSGSAPTTQLAANNSQTSSHTGEHGPAQDHSHLGSCSLGPDMHQIMAAFLLHTMTSTVPLFEEQVRRVDELAAAHPENKELQGLIVAIKSKIADEFSNEAKPWALGMLEQERDRPSIAARFPERLPEYDATYNEWKEYMARTEALLEQLQDAWEYCAELSRNGQTTLNFSPGDAGKELSVIDSEFTERRRRNLIQIQADLAQTVMRNPQIGAAMGAEAVAKLRPT